MENKPNIMIQSYICSEAHHNKKDLPFQGIDIMQLFAAPHQKDSILLDPLIAQSEEASSHPKQTEGAYKNHVFFDVVNA